ncbi:phage baseplate protein [Streptomyces sp. NPDC058256]|uniref:phage baseplate protein n=1 Tax=Streptomyces sp. NPDC058256 TaxID=3346408 RepID=UPI0036F1641E
MEQQRHGPSRRQVLRRGAGIAAVAAAGPAVTLGAAGVAHADVGATPHFYLPGDGDILVRRATLHQPNWAMQSFAFDNVNGHIYFVQDKSGQAAGNKGDLWITKTDLSGNILGAMALWNFGHGSSMGVEPVGSGSTPYLWLEGASSAEGAGQRLARFRFVDGLTLDYTNPVITIYDRTPTINSYAKLPRPAIDPYKNRLLIRYATQEPADRVWRIAVFSMADAAAGRLGQDNRLAERAIPNNKELGLSDLDLFQGIALCGQYVYLSYGDAGRGSYLVILDLNQTGGSYAEVYEHHVADSFPGRDMQGAAIWMSAGQPRLACGISAKEGTPDTFDATIFYKSQFISTWPA